MTNGSIRITFDYPLKPYAMNVMFSYVTKRTTRKIVVFLTLIYHDTPRCFLILADPHKQCTSYTESIGTYQIDNATLIEIYNKNMVTSCTQIVRHCRININPYIQFLVTMI